MAALNILQVVKFATMTWGVVPRWISGTSTKCWPPKPKGGESRSETTPLALLPELLPQARRPVSCQCRDPGKSTSPWLVLSK